jgi:type IV secretory pathway TraG/TraD family ATPase VirD4
MARAIPTGAGAGTGASGAAWVVPAVGAALVLSSGAVWVGGGVASLAAGQGWRSAPFGMLLVVDALRRGSARYWPGTSPRLVWGAAAALVVLVLLPVSALAVRWALRRPRADEPLRSLATQADVRNLVNAAAVLSAQRLRTSLAGTATEDVAAGDVGLALGELLQLGRRRGPHLVTSWEDVLLAFMAPRQGKTTTYVVPPTLEAPGAVVCTSNKADAWAATASIREQDTGERVWTFDPQAIAHAQQTWWWDPLRGLDTVEEAERLAGHFVLTVEDDRSRDIWGPAAQELLAALLLAAKTCGGTILDVYDWLNDEATPVPAEVLRGAGLRGIAASLQGTQHSPPEARGSVYFTARVAAKCLRNPAITAWVTPPPGARRLEEFDAAAFPMSRQSLYLLSKDGGGSAAPLVAALTDRVMRAGVVAAERRGGRLDPPMLVLLDEAANICRIADLPQLYSHLGSRGIIPFTILQSYPQGIGVWGETGMKALWSAATVKVIGPGIDDPSFAEDLSRLIGDHDVLVEGGSVSDGRRSRSTSLRQQRILPASVIRALPKGRALVWVTGSKVAMIRTLPWYAGRRAGEVDAARRAAEAEMTTSTGSSTAAAGLATAAPRGAGEAA